MLTALCSKHQESDVGKLELLYVPLLVYYKNIRTYVEFRACCICTEPKGSKHLHLGLLQTPPKCP